MQNLEKKKQKNNKNSGISKLENPKRTEIFCGLNTRICAGKRGDTSIQALYYTSSCGCRIAITNFINSCLVLIIKIAC